MRHAILRSCLPAILLAFVSAGPAHAGVAACYDLTTSFSPNDVNLAYQFVKDHGECVAHLEDPAFQAVAGSLTSLTLSGALKPGQCTSILNNKNLPAAQQLLQVADAGVVGAYLDCGCAVADSGIAKKIKDLVDDVVSCAKSIDPTVPIFKGLEKAGDSLGFSTLWGLEDNDPDPRAGVGNGGAPTENYAVPDCKATGIPITSWSKGWDGSSLPVGQHVRSCECPWPTRAYADGKFDPPTFHSPTFMCLVCPPSTAKDSYGNCSACMNKTGPQGFEIWAPNQDGSHCSLLYIEPKNPCQNGDTWNGKGGLLAVCCPEWKTLSADKQSCKNICQGGGIYTGINNGDTCVSCPADTLQVDNTCEACPAGSHSNDPHAKACFTEDCPPGQGLLPGSNDCGVCPPDTERKQGGICAACAQGAHSNGGDDFCSISYFGGGVSCPDGTVHPPGDNNTCVCGPGTELVDGLCKAPPPTLHAIPAGGLRRSLPPPAIVCPGETNVDGTCAQACPGFTVANPKRPGFCMDCPDGTIPDAKHLTCHAPIRLVPSAPQIH